MPSNSFELVTQTKQNIKNTLIITYTLYYSFSKYVIIIMTYLNDGEMIMNNYNEPPARVHIGTICGAETSFPLTVALTLDNEIP